MYIVITSMYVDLYIDRCVMCCEANECLFQNVADLEIEIVTTYVEISSLDDLRKK